MIQNSVIVATHPPFVAQSKHTSSKVDVYDYAANFDTLPVFETIQVVNNPELNAKLGYLVRVTVKGTTIVGEGYHGTVRAHAEIGACENFKKRAEELHQGERLMVKHINTLTSKTGHKFLEYCKMKQKDWEQYTFVSQNVNGMEISGKLYLGERLLSECIMHKYIPLDYANG
jgi:hypothetical protein